MEIITLVQNFRNLVNTRQDAIVRLANASALYALHDG